MAILGQASAILYGTSAPSNTNVIWGKTTTNDSATWALLGFFQYDGSSWEPLVTAIPSFTSATALSAYAGDANQALFSFTFSGKDYHFLMQRVISGRDPNGLSIVNHSVSGELWMRVGGTPIVFIQNLGGTGAADVSNDFFVGYELEEIKIQTTAGYDLRLSSKSTKNAASNTFDFGQTIQGKILIEIP